MTSQKLLDEARKQIEAQQNVIIEDGLAYCDGYHPDVPMLCRWMAEFAASCLAEKEKEIAELRGWKESASAVIGKVNLQEVGQELNLALGSDISLEILPAIRQFKATLKAREQEIERLKAYERGMKNHLCKYDLADWLACSGHGEEDTCAICDVADKHLAPESHCYHESAKIAQARAESAERELAELKGKREK